MDHLTAIVRESARFRAALVDADPGAPVPTCPGWSADDLLHHLAEVQDFWAYVLREGVTDEPDRDPPPCPGTRAGLLAVFDTAHAALVDQLGQLDPTETRWSWAEEQTVGFTLRRQAHEALVHRVDAELTVGAARAPIDPELATDGVAEALEVMYGGIPRWADFVVADPGVVELHAIDTDRRWHLRVGRMVGTAPSGTAYDLAALDLVPAPATTDEPVARITAEAADLDLWLWGRPAAGDVVRRGDAGPLARLQAVLDEGIA